MKAAEVRCPEAVLDVSEEANVYCDYTGDSFANVCSRRAVVRLVYESGGVTYCARHRPNLDMNVVGGEDE